MPDIRSAIGRRGAWLCAAAVFCLLDTVAAATCGDETASDGVGSVCGRDVTAPNAMVVTADSIASAVGNRVLVDGGNAIDAAVAAGFALAVTLPRAGNIGGGGFMLVRLANGGEEFIDYREQAPLDAHRDMYIDDAGKVIPEASTVGHLAAAVPGTVYGLAIAHEKHGTLPWKRLLEPAIELARDGFAVNPSLARSLRKSSTLLNRFEESRLIFVGPGYRPGDRLVQPDLAATLERIAEDWTDFYSGTTARLIVEEMKRGGGLITVKDLGAYHAVAREPIRVRYRDHEIVSAPLPSSGGVILSQLFQILERHGASSLRRQSAAYVHLVSEAEKVAYRGRALYLGDADFYGSPWEKMIDPRTIQDLSDLISSEETLRVDSLESTNLLSGTDHGVTSFEQTTHISVVDGFGNAVANTYTLNGSYGSGVVVKGAGFILNNEMDDFAIKPGYPNLYGLVGSEANAIAPGKRMLSSMSPTFVYKGDKLYMVVGTPGGATIPTSVFQVIVNVIDRGMGLGEAVAARRFHEQYLPDRIYIENGALAPDVIDELLAIGHRIEIRKPIGNIQAILIEDGTLTGVSDPRGSGRAIGH
ncbi:MAG: gamma-glutamyltransferase [Candidatus Krumholzibacteria bacterium]|nr:gamma-glutamyltransferase [Candidatus Krumholzibacteria bacterium]